MEVKVSAVCPWLERVSIENSLRRASCPRLREATGVTVFAIRMPTANSYKTHDVRSGFRDSMAMIGPARREFTRERPAANLATELLNTFAAHLPRLAFGLVAFLGPINALAAGSGVVLEQGETQLRVTWPMSAKESGVAVFSLDETKPHIESLGVAARGQPATVVMRTLSPVTLLTVGSRDSKNPQGWGAFFDNTPIDPTRRFSSPWESVACKQRTMERAPRSVSWKQRQAVFAATSGSRFIAIAPSSTSRPW